MSYPTFLLQWYNWPYLAALALTAVTLTRIAPLARVGALLGGWLGLRRVAGRIVLRVFAIATGVVGLTLSGAVHDYWPRAQERFFVPGLIVTLALAALATRAIGRVLDRHFPEIKAIGWGGPGLSGLQGRVVSRSVSQDYRAGRAQVMGDDETMHIVMCKTRAGEIPYGAVVALGEYDQSDGRYFVEQVDESTGS